MSKKQDPNKPKLMTRIKDWGLQRVLPKGVSGFAKHNIMRSTSVALDALKPNRFDKEEMQAGYKGRYTDGGRARFATMAHERGLNNAAIDVMSRQRRNAAMIYFAGSIFTFALGIYVMFTEEHLVMIFGGAGTSIAGLALSAVAVYFDFMSWQLAERRFGGFQEYLETRI